MHTRTQFRLGLGLVMLFVSMPLWAGIPITTGILSNPTNVTLTSTALATGSPTQTVTLTYASNGAPDYYYSALSALSITGANASDFAIVGGTCVPGTTQLGSSNTSCTVIIKYTPSTTSPESAQLTGTCSTFVAVGGFTLSCNGVGGQLSSLVGVLLAALASTPALDPKVLTALSLLLLGIGAYFAGRRKA